MKLNMQLLCSALKDYSPTAQIGTCTDLYLNGARLWDGNISALKANYVYVTTAECLMSCEDFGELTDVICVGSNRFLFHKFLGRTNIIAVDAPVQLLDLFNQVAEIFDMFSGFEREFLLALADHKSIDELLQIASNFFDNPMILLDKSMMRVAVVSDRNGKHMDEENWKSILKDGHVETDALKIMAYRISQEGDKSTASHKKAHFDSVHPTRYSSIAAPIWDEEQKMIGVLLVPEEFNKLNQGFLGIADFIAEHLSGKLVQIEQQYKNRYSSLEQFWGNLLKGLAPSKEFSRFQLSQLGWLPEDHYIVCTVELNESESIGAFHNYGAKLLKSILGDCFYLVFEAKQVFIINVERYPMREETLNRLNQALLNRETYAGMSMQAHGLALIDSQYTLALEALRIGKKQKINGNLFHYEDIVENHIIDMAIRPANMMAMCLPNMLALYQSDVQNGTEYINTLYVYLRNERSPLKTANQLFIHRNSLMYRMEKINNLLQCDYENIRLRTHLLISCKILRYYYWDMTD